VALPDSEGGAGFDHIAYSIVIEEISRCCASTGVILSVQNSLYCDPIHRFGNDEQKKKFLLPFARGEKIGCYALTEPQAGSNAAALQTKAVKKGDTYVLNGTKAWITNGAAADAAIVYVNTDPPKGEKGITALVVEKGTPGFKVGKEEKKLGISATACSELVFTDCEVPTANRIGNEGEGYKVALSTLDGGRIGIGAQACGIAQGALEAALAYSKERLAFGHPISQFQAIQFMLADMSTEIDAARLLIRKAAMEAGHRCALQHGRGHRQTFRQRDGHARHAQSHPDSRRATATAGNIRSSVTTATRASPKSTKAPAKYSVW
jgi:butyryl-CoA dehydrogenase